MTIKNKATDPTSEVRDKMDKELNSKTNLPQDLLWLADAPLFINANLVERFYDAIVRPDSLQGSTTLNITKETVENISKSFGIDLKLSPGALATQLSSVFAFINPSVGASAKMENSKKTTAQESHKIEFHPISNPERQLIQLVFHYLINQPNRIFFVNNAKPSDGKWRETARIIESPRALLFLDLPGEYDVRASGQPRTKIIPTAMEVEGGKVEPLYNQLVSREGKPLPEYPSTATPEKTLPQLRMDYWKWFDDNFDATNAMMTLEKTIAAVGKPVRWIDFRVPLTEAGHTLHLHVANTGNYDTGVFAYNLIKRGYKHGLRLVGTLKAEPDMNVLAIYEK